MHQTDSRALEAFCSSCPDPNEVAAVLQGFGFQLTFSMKAAVRRTTTVSIPAQYHFDDPDGTEILYLAGRDVGDEKTRLPRHESRFWAFSGADSTRYQLVISILANRWTLHWQTPLAQQAA